MQVIAEKKKQIDSFENTTSSECGEDVYENAYTQLLKVNNEIVTKSNYLKNQKFWSKLFGTITWQNHRIRNEIEKNKVLSLTNTQMAFKGLSLSIDLSYQYIATLSEKLYRLKRLFLFTVSGFIILYIIQWIFIILH